MPQSIFTTELPTLTDATDGTPYTLCTLWRPGVNGTVTHGRWHFPATLPSLPPVFALYRWISDSSGIELVRATFSSPVPGTWNTVPIPPTAVEAAAFYYAAVYTVDRYVASVGLFNGLSVISGDLIAPADDPLTPRRNGRFNDFGTSPNYPDVGGGSCYFPDVVFEPGDVAPIVVPGLLVASGRAATLTAGATAGSLIAAGRAGSLVTGGQP